MINEIIWLASILLFVVWGYILWRLTQSKYKYGSVYFYLLLFTPILLPLLLTLITGGMVSLMTMGMMGFILFIVLIVYLGLWSYTLYEVGGEDKLVWFILILLLSPFWIIYRIVGIR
jgi:hypothetical protein